MLAHCEYNLRACKRVSLCGGIIATIQLDICQLCLSNYTLYGNFPHNRPDRNDIRKTSA
ncbi:hypothetical protein PL9631_1060261 [Planktothrix paucivesiculata PCC 9631]|uniref:Uncharacterized protein n=1 Tax=Planktothrix paucivesiculata PCC 9631 TaxID=671071 RepID=A0A7Z9BKJ9_9CYAN|nr:hypothetical protein PL9631_1060261 [Planktothrix paucivesiculata PCC 9631]